MSIPGSWYLILSALLFGIGGALNEYKFSESWRQALAMTVLKLIIHPLIAWTLMGRCSTQFGRRVEHAVVQLVVGRLGGRHRDGGSSDPRPPATLLACRAL